MHMLCSSTRESRTLLSATVLLRQRIAGESAVAAALGVKEKTCSPRCSSSIERPPCCWMHSLSFSHETHGAEEKSCLARSVPLELVRKALDGQTRSHERGGERPLLPQNVSPPRRPSPDADAPDTRPSDVSPTRRRGVVRTPRTGPVEASGSKATSRRSASAREHEMPQQKDSQKAQRRTTC